MYHWSLGWAQPDAGSRNLQAGSASGSSDAARRSPSSPERQEWNEMRCAHHGIIQYSLKTAGIVSCVYLTSVCWCCLIYKIRYKSFLPQLYIHNKILIYNLTKITSADQICIYITSTLAVQSRTKCACLSWMKYNVDTVQTTESTSLCKSGQWVLKSTCRVGRSIKMCLSSLPGLMRALSKISALLVEARTMTWSVVPIPANKKDFRVLCENLPVSEDKLLLTPSSCSPSISTSSWLRVCSSSVLEKPDMLVERFFPTASISSM